MTRWWLLVIPYALLGVLFTAAWAVAVARLRRSGLLARIARIGLWAMALALIAGEIYNGLWKAAGFNWPLSLLGLLLMALAILLATGIGPVQGMLRRIGATGRELATALKEAPAQATARPRPGLRILVSVAVTAVAGLVLFSLASANQNLCDNPRPFLDVLQQVGDQHSIPGILGLESCVHKQAYNPFSLLLMGLVDGLSQEEALSVYFKFNTGAFLLILALGGLLLGRRFPPHLVVISQFVFLLALIQGERVHTDDYVESAFAALFMIDLLLILFLRMRWTNLLLTGFVTGLAVTTKEVALINLFLLLVVLIWRASPDGRTVRIFLTVFAGLAAGLLPAVFFLATCGQTEGFSHTPYLFFRGTALQAMSQEVAHRLFADGFQVSLLDVLLNRLNFQSIGEVFVGGLVALGPFCLGLLPLPYLLPNLRRNAARALLVFLVIAWAFYGLSYWKGGDSANPFYTTVPFGFVFFAPFAWRLIRAIAAAARRSHLLRPVGLVLLALAAWNLLIMAALVHGSIRNLGVLTRVRSIGFEGVELRPALDAREQALVAALKVQMGEAGFLRVPAEGCDLADLAFLASAGLEVRVATLDPPVSFVEAIGRADVAEMTALGRLHHRAGAESGLVLVCGPRVRIPGELRTSGCLRILHEPERGSGVSLLRLTYARCAQLAGAEPSANPSCSDGSARP